MSQFYFISWNYKNNSLSIFFHFHSYPISLQSFEIHFPIPADLWLIQIQHIFFAQNQYH